MYQNKNSNNDLSVNLIVSIVIVLTLLFSGCGLVITRNDFVSQETGLEAQYQENQNSYASYFNKLKETAQIPEVYANDLNKLYKNVMTNRYGENGSSAVMQFIQESNPNLDVSLYKQVQQVIEAGRDKFESDQKTLLDKRRQYQTDLNTFPASIIAKLFGFPTIDLKKFDPVINQETENAFKTKNDKPIKVF